MSIPTFDDVVLKTISDQLSLMADRLNEDSVYIHIMVSISGSKTGGYKLDYSAYDSAHNVNIKAPRLEDFMEELERRRRFIQKSKTLELTYRPGRDDEVQRVETPPPAEELVEAVQSMEPVDDIPF